MKRRVLALLLALTLGVGLSLSPARAAGEVFPVVRTYAAGTYGDVPAGCWYEAAAQLCYERGLITGTDRGFEPDAPMPLSQVAALAARVRAALRGETIPAGEAGGSHWYDPAVSYLVSAGVTLPSGSLERTATRLEFFQIMAQVVPESELKAINAISSLPDTQDPAVLRFYNAGILTGVDEYGTLDAQGSLDRAMCATLLARVIDPSQRRRFTPKVKEDPDEVEKTMAVMVNGVAVPMSRYVYWLDRVIYREDLALLQRTGKRLDWNAAYLGIDDLPGYFKDLALDATVRYALMEQKAAGLGCAVSDLAQAVTPDPAQSALAAYAASQDYLAAKHILILTTDPQTGKTVRPDAEALATAKNIVSALSADPTSQQFENLLAVYNEDPGMESYPEGYLFQTGEMVEEFEGAVRKLGIDEYTLEPVKPGYGYHVIWRLDPTGLTELKEAYQDATLESLVTAWAQGATVTPNKALIQMVDAKGCYEAYLKQLGG